MTFLFTLELKLHLKRIFYLIYVMYYILGMEGSMDLLVK